MSLHVTVRDEQEGTVEEVRIPDGEYFLLTVGDCHVANAQHHANGTHVLTVKGRNPLPLPDVPSTSEQPQAEATS